MEIILYKTGSRVNDLIKESDEQTLTLEGSLKKNVDILKPVIMVNSNPMGFNYAYVADFSRYYWVDGISQYRKNLWILNLSVDVLMSYSDQIKLLSGYVNRYDDGNKYATRNLVKDVRKNVKQIKWDYEFTKGSYVLVARGGDI